MKKSERYYLAMLAVLDCACITAEDKLEVLATLMEDESVAKYVENKEAEKAWNEEANLA